MNGNRNDDRWVRPESQRRQNARPVDPNRAGDPTRSGQPNRVDASRGGQYRGDPARRGQPGVNYAGSRQAGARRAVSPNARGAAQSAGDAEKKKKRSVIGARIALTAVIFVVLCGVIGGIVACRFYSTPDKEDSSVKYTYGKETVKVDESLAYHDSRLYLSFTKLASYLGMSTTGDASSVRFIFASDGASSAGSGEEYAEFFKDDMKAIVSGTEIRMIAPAYFSGGEVYVPAEFVELYMDGLTLDINESKHTVTVRRNIVPETDENGEHPDAEVSFKIKASVAPEPIETADDTYVPAPEVSFKSDLSEYEQYMNPSDDKEYLVLVNKTTTVGADFAPDDLIPVKATRQDGRATQQMRECAEKALEALYIEMAADGYTDVSVTSAYRSYEYQESLYSGYVAQEMAGGLSEAQAIAEVDTYSARPGTSEHQTGLCCDMHNLPSADQSFAAKEVYSWLKANAWKFGFIERFPLGKEDVTGYSFEPWHYRFVGRRAAAQIHERGITLEEYLAG